ncbi:GntR family transcriptional regulator [Ammoniphilus sp. YIM 78166]|uniref:GntR family transcriptional regulator n=1 Tax=Ammoniphilus sp. YIM 78166 TaxID=1644106 RepID=UPI00106F4BDF|nr:GntR family transcriptional regulator [Ammoniphilus sp. YIM 78166]
MNKKHIDNNALSNLIKQSITEDIILGKIQPGEKLIETKYAEEFGTSRAPIREAFYLLTLEGFAQKIPRKGTVVRGYTAEEIKDLLEIRIFLENLAVEKLEGKDITSYLERMREIMSQMEGQVGSDYTKLNYEFHYQLILACESEVIKNMYSRLGTPLLSVQTMAFIEEQDIRRSLAEHREIVQLLQDDRIQEAKALLDAHNRTVFPRISKYVTK